MIGALLFDLDGTLLDRTSSLRLFLLQQVERRPDLLGHLDPTKYVNTVLKLDGRGHTPKDALYQQAAAHFDLAADAWQTLLADHHAYFPHVCVPFPRMHQTLEHFHRQGLPLGLVTNGLVASQQPKIDGLGIGRYFDAVLISEAEGVKKPDPEIFRRALDKMGTQANRTAMIGDNPTADIAGARALGLKTIWKKDPHWPPPQAADAVIEDLDQLSATVDRLNRMP